MSYFQQLHNLLKNTSVTSIGTSEENIITEKSSTSLSKCFQTLSTQNIHSLPVINNEGRFTSFIDIWDLVHKLVGSFSAEELKKNQIPKMLEWNGEYIRVLDEKQKLWDVPSAPKEEEKIDTFKNTIVGDVAQNPFEPLTDDKSLFDLLQHMNSKKLHRIPIVNSKDDLIRIITQMDLIQWIESQFDSLSSILELSVSELSLDKNNDVLKVDSESPALEAFKLINEKKITGIPVVDKDNIVIGNISTSDLRVILHNADEFLHLYLPTSEYIKKIHERNTHAPHKEISVTPSTNFKNVVRSFTNHRVHRVFVTDETGHLDGVITLTDVLNSIL